MKPIFRFRLVLSCIFVPLFAYSAWSSDTKEVNRKQRATSEIFSDIMQTLPNNMKAKVDSASCARNNRNAAAAKANSASDSRTKVTTVHRDGVVQNLPEDVRGKVEKAILDVDLMNQDRQVQFKEYEKKHPGRK
jgi:hypothetical protein